MTTKIQSIHFDADQKLLAYVEEKVAKLSRYFDGILESEVYLKLDKSATHENKVAEIKVHIPGNDLFVKKQSETFESAIDQAIEALSIQVKKHKDKIQGN